MVGIKQAISNVLGTKIEKSELDDKKLEGVTPVEREVMSFRERERQDNLKKELLEYRKKNSMLNDNQGMHQSIISQPPTLFKQEARFSLFSTPNKRFRKHSSILNIGGNSLW